MTNRIRIDSLLLAGFCAFLFFYGLGQVGLIGADEPRYAQVAREMLERRDWITPALGNQPWLEKPPLYYWQAAIAFEIFGASDWAARLPSAFDATLLVMVIYLFLRRFQPGVEVDGALIAASSAAIVGYARAASVDMALAACFAIAMLGWWAWRQSGQKRFLIVFYGLMACGTLAKGPVAPFLAAAVILLYATMARERHFAIKTIWPPGILLYVLIALPWYVAVQLRNPVFFREFILEHNLGRFSRNLYHHTEPMWFYLPVAALALLPWTVFVVAAVAQGLRVWWSARRLAGHDSRRNHPRELNDFGVFAACWLIVPIVFFSLSHSKLPGYILPAVPAGGLLLAHYLRCLHEENRAVSNVVIVLHALAASSPIVPALLIGYLVTQHRLPGGRPVLVALAIAFVLCAGIALTLARRSGLRMLRFVTLIPVVLTVGATLKLGAASLDATLSARPVARELAALETHTLPLAVLHVRRELEYGLTFYRNHLTFNYDWGSVPQEEHLLVAAENSRAEIALRVHGRRVSFIGHYPAQHVDYYWVAAANSGR